PEDDRGDRKAPAALSLPVLHPRTPALDTDSNPREASALPALSCLHPDPTLASPEPSTVVEGEGAGLREAAPDRFRTELRPRLQILGEFIAWSRGLGEPLRENADLREGGEGDLHRQLEDERCPAVNQDRQGHERPS